MAIVFAAITPHPPMIIPSIGKEKVKLLEKTRQAFLRLEQELYVAKPQVIVIVSPHSSLFPDAFSLNAHTSFVSDFAKFGDLITSKEWRGSPELAAKIAHIAKERGIRVQQVSQDKLDHGATIPLFLLTGHMDDVRVMPVGYANLSAAEHVQFGALLKDGLLESNKRIAVIASGDLTHTENPIPATENRRFPFDEKIIDALGRKDIAGLSAIGVPEREAARECGYRSILVALGMIEHMDYSFETYSYEAPFGVGYLTANFHV